MKRVPVLCQAALLLLLPLPLPLHLHPQVLVITVVVAVVSDVHGEAISDGSKPLWLSLLVPLLVQLSPLSTWIERNE